MTEQMLGSILEQKMLESLGYKLHPRTFQEIKPYLFQEQDKFNYFPHRVVYTGAENSGNPALGIPKLPNITVLPNLEAGVKGKIILGSTFGHTHCENDLRPFQEIYEFQGYGAMLLHDGQHKSNCREDYHQKARLHLLQKGDKITVGSSENMTLFNFEREELVTLDFAHPQRNKAHKNLEKKLGTMLMISVESIPEMYGPTTVTFYFNKKYVAEGIIKAQEGQGPSAQKGRISLLAPGTSVNLLVSSPADTLGGRLYDTLAAQHFHFQDLGIEVIKGGNIRDDENSRFSKPLLELAINRDEELLKALGMSA